MFSWVLLQMLAHLNALVRQVHNDRVEEINFQRRKYKSRLTEVK